MNCIPLLCLLATANLLAAASADKPRLIASPEPEWAQWRGPQRDGTSLETGLLQQWPAGGPKLLWTSEGLGRGYSAPVIQNGRLYLTGESQERLEILALDLTGKVLWRATNGRAWKGPYPGARASCTLGHGRLFHLNAHGRAVCLEPASGREVWAVDILERFGSRNITWALSECLLVDGSRVFVMPGGPGTLLAALDVATGATLWQSGPLLTGPSADPAQRRVLDPAGEADLASYAPPTLALVAGHRQVLGCSQRHAFGADAASGKLLWTYPLPTRYDVIAATPVVCDQGVFVTAPDAGGGRLLQVTSEAGALRVEKAWGAALDTCHGGLVCLDGRLYGSWYRAGRGWACVDAASGKVLYETRDLAKGSILAADNRLYCLAEDGEMGLLEAAADRFVFHGRFRLAPARTSDAWAHPVIHRQRLYLRFHDRLSCYDLRRSSSSSPPPP